jgi:hypothetical protein
VQYGDDAYDTAMMAQPAISRGSTLVRSASAKQIYSVPMVQDLAEAGRPGINNTQYGGYIHGNESAPAAGRAKSYAGYVHGAAPAAGRSKSYNTTIVESGVENPSYHVPSDYDDAGVTVPADGYSQA